MKFSRMFLFMVSVFVTAQSGVARAGCPNSAVDPFLGRWEGTAYILAAAIVGQKPGMVPKAIPKSVDEFKKTPGQCETFSIKIDYYPSNAPDAPIVRTVEFTATVNEKDKDKDPSEPIHFAILGTVKDAGKEAKEMKGSVRAVEPGTFIATFQSAMDGQVAYFTELINVTKALPADPTNRRPAYPKELIRTMQIFGGMKGGPYQGTKVTREQFLGN